MSYANPDRIVPVPRYPVYSLLLPIAGTCLAATLLTDLAYWRTAEMMWTDFSAWLVAAGTIVGYVALIAALIELSIRRVQRPPWPYLIGNLVALLLATLNMFVHTRDAWTSVVPWGLILSAIVAFILLCTGVMRWAWSVPIWKTNR
jgi:uncharacterized membrane protein